MNGTKNREILKRCIDIEPSEKITKVRDWKLIEKETIILQSVNLDRLTEDDEWGGSPYAEIRCFIELDEDGDYRFCYGRDIFVALFAEDNDRPEIYQFSKLLQAADFVNEVVEKFFLWKNRFDRPNQLILENAQKTKEYRLRAKSNHAQGVEEGATTD